MLDCKKKMFDFPNSPLKAGNESENVFFSDKLTEFAFQKKDVPVFGTSFEWRDSPFLFFLSRPVFPGEGGVKEEIHFFRAFFHLPPFFCGHCFFRTGDPDVSATFFR